MDKIWKIGWLVVVLLIAVSVFVSVASGASSSTEQIKTCSEINATIQALELPSYWAGAGIGTPVLQYIFINCFNPKNLDKIHFRF